MVYIVEVKPGLFYAYKCVRLPGHRYPVKQYIGPASQAMIKRERRKQAETTKQKKRRCSPTDTIASKRLDYKGEMIE